MNPVLKAKIELFKRGDYTFLDLEPKQEQALKVLCQSDEVNELAFGGAAGGGKSWIGCVWLLFSALAYPETKWFLARDKLTDLMKSTYKTFYKVCKHYDVPTTEFSFNGQYNYFKFKNGSEIDLVKLQYMPSDPDYDGVGSTEYTGGWIEEAAQIMKMAYIVMKSRIGRQFNDRYKLPKKLLITLNPSKGWPYQFFYKPYKANKLEKEKNFIQALVDDNSKIDSGYIESLDKLEDKAKKQRLRYGNWEYDGDESILIPYDAILSIWENNHVKKYAGSNYITADIALQGSDKFVIAVWKGFAVIDLQVIDKCDAKEVEKIIRKKAYQYSVPQYRVAYDSDGLGSYLRGYMELAKPFVNNSPPVKGNTESSEYNQFKEEYRNLKAQCYFRLAALIRAGKMYIECDLGEHKDTLIEELETVKNASHGTDDKLAVLKKDEVKELIGRSPDFSDCLMMRMYFTLHNKLSDIRDIRFYAADI